MATIQRQILDAIVARLKASPRLLSKPDRIRVSHRTPVTRDQAPAIYVVPIDDTPDTPKDCTRRRLRLRVAVLARDDGGVDSIDELMIAVMARLRPAKMDPIPYPPGTVLRYGAIRFDEEDADEDVALAEMEFEASYTAADWLLDA